jgi:hypothetical protein
LRESWCKNNAPTDHVHISPFLDNYCDEPIIHPNSSQIEGSWSSPNTIVGIGKDYQGSAKETLPIIMKSYRTFH